MVNAPPWRGYHRYLTTYLPRGAPTVKHTEFERIETEVADYKSVRPEPAPGKYLLSKTGPKSKLRLKIAAAIATSGRREGLGQMLDYLRLQTRCPDALYVAPASSDDFDPQFFADYPCPAFAVYGPKGLPAQRNTILRATDADVVIFFDDDFLPEADFIKETEALFLRRPDMVMATGHVLADGIHGPGLSFEAATSIISAQAPSGEESLMPVFNAYGCNMAIRASLARERGIEFDEALPLYAWWEDVDMSRRLAPHGSILRSNRLRGVHMGSKSGRTPGKRLGYAQVSNIAHMIKKGSIPPGIGMVRISRNVIANTLKQFRPEPWIDRRGRFIGNLMAIADVLRGHIDPGKILKL